MKVLFTIFTGSHGNGGHFYSLATTALALSGKMDVVIVNVGYSTSPVLEKSGLNVHNIIRNKCSITSIYEEFKTITVRESPDVIHSFCSTSYLFARKYATKNKTRKILTKCGGPDPKRYYPYADHLILFSEENSRYFENSAKYRDTKRWIIPNRVTPVEPDKKRLEDLIKIIPDDEIIFLRISRITAHYEKTTMQAMELVKEINRKIQRAKLLLIGTVQNTKALHKIKQFNEGETIIITDDYYTKKASELIDIADVVIGTGRSLMEAASRGKVLMTPAEDSIIPVLLNETNFHGFLKTNFSPRNQSNVDSGKQLEEIKKILSDRFAREKAEEFSKKIFDEYFDINAVVKKYGRLYDDILNHPEKAYFDYLIHTLYVKRIFRLFNAEK